MTETYTILSNNIKTVSKDVDELNKIESKLNRFYDNGLITGRELQTLNTMIMTRLAKIDNLVKQQIN